MSKYDENASKKDLYARVKLAPVNAIQRALAVNAMRDADAISNGIMWAMKGISHLFTRAPQQLGQLAALGILKFCGFHNDGAGVRALSILNTRPTRSPNELVNRRTSINSAL